MKWIFRPLIVAVTAVTFSAQAVSAASLPVLSMGSRGSDVALVQRLLTYHGEPVAITSLLGPTTEGLIKRFQSRQGLQSSGVVGAATWRALQPVLRRGNSGQAVKALQIALNEKHGYGLATDGVFGWATQAAVIRFQQHMGLSADGVAGPATWSALTSHFVQVAASTPYWYRYSDSGGEGAWGRAHTVTVLSEVARKWLATGQTQRLGVGDVSLQHGGPMPGHASHQRGVDVDLRLMRQDGREIPVDYRSEEYSRALTQQLVNLLWATGEVELILFNDPAVEGVSPWPGHDSHLHVRFKR